MSARTLPVTPAERACATITAAWLKWPGTARQPHQDALQSALMAIGDILIDAGLVNDDYKATPAGAALLARVEADRSAEDIARDLVMALQTSGAPGVLVSEAQSVLVNVRACDRRLAGTTPIDAPPASPERPAYARAKALIDALNKDGGGAVVNGMLHAAIIAEANARDADRVEAAERTPETVLRAMLVSYEADAIEKARAYYADPGVDASLLRATNEADTDVEIVRDQLAILLAKGFTTFTVSMSTIGADYAARLAGTTPIDAPPAKEPAR